MILRLHLMGALKEKAPPGNQLEVAEGTTLAEVLERLGISPAEIQVVMVNGKPQPDHTAVLQEGDELTFLAPVGGG